MTLEIDSGIAASGTTPFTIGALRAASTVGAITIAPANNPGAPDDRHHESPLTEAV